MVLDISKCSFKYAQKEKRASYDKMCRKDKKFFIILIAGFLFLLGISFTSSSQARVFNNETTESGHFKADFFYQALAAELYTEMGDEVLAVEQYQSLALESQDPAVARRVTILAAATGQLLKGLKVAERWVALTPENLESRQYLALLYLRNSKIELSASQLHIIRGLVESNTSKQETSKSAKLQRSGSSGSVNKLNVSRGLTFIGSVLAAETHRDKAYRVFVAYLKKNGSQDFYQQQQLIAANLALKAKNYEAVIADLDGLAGLDQLNLVDAAAMKAKALHKLNRLPEAIKVLMSIKDIPLASDSSRLELVRLLVLQKQKKKALPILQQLIVKHKNNKDLLKSLIALQIDQGQLHKAEKNIIKLRSSRSYLYDADYFSGEVLEAKGSLEKALKYYKKVSGGSFLRNAHHKVLFITKKTKGGEGVTRLFEEKQELAKNKVDKAYWSKLYADHLFDVKKYQRSLDLYNQAIALSPLKPQYYYRRGLLHERMRNLDSAEKDFNQVLSIRKNDADTLNALGYMLSVNTNRLVEAKQYISKAHQIKPHDPVIMDSLGFVHFKTGNLLTAEKYLRKAFKLIKDPEVASHLINVLAKVEKYDEAKRIYHEMTKKYPDNKILHEAKQYLQN